MVLGLYLTDLLLLGALWAVDVGLIWYVWHFC
jgi:hypothetical protein